MREMKIAEPASTRDITACNLARKGGERNTKQIVGLHPRIFHRYPRVSLSLSFSLGLNGNSQTGFNWEVGTSQLEIWHQS